MKPASVCMIMLVLIIQEVDPKCSEAKMLAVISEEGLGGRRLGCGGGEGIRGCAGGVSFCFAVVFGFILVLLGRYSSRKDTRHFNEIDG